MTYEDFPFAEIAAKGKDLVDRGCDVFFKWTCVGCGARQVFDTPNVLYTQGKCEECGTITDLREHGGNYALAIPLPL